MISSAKFKLVRVRDHSDATKGTGVVSVALRMFGYIRPHLVRATLISLTLLLYTLSLIHI